MFSHWCCRWYAGGGTDVPLSLAMDDGEFNDSGGSGGGGCGGPAAVAAAAVAAVDNNWQQKRPAMRALTVA
jgi:hypothetical protein